MGEAELHTQQGILMIRSHIITYGNAADEMITEQIRSEIETMWNEPAAVIEMGSRTVRVQFEVTAQCKKDLDQLEVLQNVNPRNNYFRIEDFVHGNISFVDGLGCNTGYFLIENLYQGSTTAAHEYGHTLGLPHPDDMDYRGRGIPGIMYPRGTLVDPSYQYDSRIPAGRQGGTMHPQFRKVLPDDIRSLKLHRLRFSGGRAVVGEFTNVYHWDHRHTAREDFNRPPIVG
jgi:hypothetical protein